MLTDVGERVTDPGIFYLGTLPDLTDPCTLGGLLSLVREAWGMPRLVAIPQPDGEWSVWGLASVASDITEAAALVSALEVAP